MKQISERLVLAFDKESDRNDEEMRRLENGYFILGRGRNETKDEFYLMVLKGEMESSNLIVEVGDM